jgi:hypothetical protein
MISNRVQEQAMRMRWEIMLGGFFAIGCGGSGDKISTAPVDPAKMNEQIKSAQKAESGQKPLPDVVPGQPGGPPP